MNLHLKVWARVQWYWSGTDVAGIIKSLFVISSYILVCFLLIASTVKPLIAVAMNVSFRINTTMSRRNLSMVCAVAINYPIIRHSRDIPGLAIMHDYFEHELAQKNIDSDDFYCRYTLEVKVRKFDVSPFVHFPHRY